VDAAFRWGNGGPTVIAEGGGAVVGDRIDPITGHLKLL